MKMGRIDAVISDETEKNIRTYLRKKGDLSRIVEEALINWLLHRKQL